MNKEEARGILGRELGKYRGRSFAELKRLLEVQETFELTGESGAVYGLEFQAVWDDRKKTTLRVMGSIDDGRWSAFHPLTESFLIRADGSFVGE